MLVSYISPKTLHQAIIRGCQSIVLARDQLNAINFFPVADGDTGDNLASLPGKELERYCIIHANADEKARDFAKRTTEIFQKPPAYIEHVSPAIGLHAGGGCVAIAVRISDISLSEKWKRNKLLAFLFHFQCQGLYIARGWHETLWLSDLYRPLSKGH